MDTHTRVWSVDSDRGAKWASTTIHQWARGEAEWRQEGELRPFEPNEVAPDLSGGLAAKASRVW